MSDLNGELLTLLATSNEEQKAAAVRLLRGEASPASTVERPEPYVTLREVARQLGVSACSLWRWQVPGHELGGRRRFRLSEVAAYLESDGFRERAEELKRERRGAVSGQ